MADVQSRIPSDDVSRNVAKAGWGVLLIWVGAVLLLHWGWGVGLLGAGAVLLAAQGVRRRLGLKVEGFGLVAGALLVVCGAADLFQVRFDLVPALCIVGGIALLVSTWVRRDHRAPGGPTDLKAASTPRT
jgi:hypothetical protein